MTIGILFHFFEQYPMSAFQIVKNSTDSQTHTKISDTH